MRKMLVSDYDGTLHVFEEQLFENIEKVREFMAAGGVFVLATGRSYYDFHWLEEKYNIPYDALILDHGTLILSRDGEVLYSDAFPDALLSEMITDMETESARRVFCCSEMESRVDVTHGNISKINVWYESDETAERIANLLNAKYGDMVNAYYIPAESIEVIPKTSSKLAAIEWVRGKLGVAAENVFTVGDGYSDIEMVRAYNGYAMEHSVPEMYEAALGRISSVGELIGMINKQ